jgi:hypothetical protein
VAWRLKRLATLPDALLERGNLRLVAGVPGPRAVLSRSGRHQIGDVPYTRWMTLSLAEYIDAGKALDVTERLEVAHQLLLSVDQDTAGGDGQAAAAAEWEDVVDRRVREILDGTARTIDGREGLARIRAKLATKRP